MGGVTVVNDTEQWITFLTFAFVPTPWPTPYFVALEDLAPGQKMDTHAFLGACEVTAWPRQVGTTVLGIDFKTFLGSVFAAINAGKIALKVASAVGDPVDVSGLVFEAGFCSPLVDHLMHWFLNVIEKKIESTLVDAAMAQIKMFAANHARGSAGASSQPQARSSAASTCVSFTWGLNSSRTVHVRVNEFGALTLIKPSVWNLSERNHAQQ